jgi:ribosomal protein L32E
MGKRIGSSWRTPHATSRKIVHQLSKPTNALHEAWATPDAIGFKHLALGENAVILATEVVGYRLHGSQETGSAQM